MAGGAWRGAWLPVALCGCVCARCVRDLQVYANAITGTVPTWLSVLTQLTYVWAQSSGVIQCLQGG